MSYSRFAVLMCGVMVIILCGCGQKPVQLFNGSDLKGWKFALVDSDVNPSDVWSVNNGVIHCKGVPNGYMYTATAYADYTLTLEWRWAGEAGNSGVLLHAQEPGEVWPKCIECQLKSGNAGDFVLMGPSKITVNGKNYVNTERFLGIPKKAASSEKTVGEWNRYKIICRGDEITCYVNDVLQNVGTQASFSKGSICLQSEGAPIQFRNIRIEPLD